MPCSCGGSTTSHFKVVWNGHFKQRCYTLYTHTHTLSWNRTAQASLPHTHTHTQMEQNCPCLTNTQWCPCSAHSPDPLRFSVITHTPQAPVWASLLYTVMETSFSID